MCLPLPLGKTSQEEKRSPLGASDILSKVARALPPLRTFPPAPSLPGPLLPPPPRGEGGGAPGRKGPEDMF